MTIEKGQGQKFDDSKPQWILLPWVQVEEVVKVLTFGAKKYAPGNWQKVRPGEERYLSACYRHLASIHKGESLDKETGYSHYAHAICSLLFAFWHSLNKPKQEAQNESNPINRNNDDTFNS